MEGGIVCVSNQYLHFHVTHCQRVAHVPWLDVTCFVCVFKVSLFSVYSHQHLPGSACLCREQLHACSLSQVLGCHVVATDGLKLYCMSCVDCVQTFNSVLIILHQSKSVFLFICSLHALINVHSVCFYCYWGFFHYNTIKYV